MSARQFAFVPSRQRKGTMNKKLAIVTVMPFLLSACMTQNNYQVTQEALRGSPALRSDFQRTCVNGTRQQPLANRQMMAKLMNVSVNSAPQTYCQRVTRGIANGRITLADMRSGGRGQMTPNMVRVLQGR